MLARSWGFVLRQCHCFAFFHRNAVVFPSRVLVISDWVLVDVYQGPGSSRAISFKMYIWNPRCSFVIRSSLEKGTLGFLVVFFIFRSKVSKWISLERKVSGNWFCLGQAELFNTFCCSIRSVRLSFRVLSIRRVEGKKRQGSSRAVDQIFIVQFLACS